MASQDETGGLSSPAGHMREIHEVSDVAPDRTLDDDRSYSLAHACPICGARFKDMFIHYRKKHPTVSVPALYKKQTNRRNVKGCFPVPRDS